MAQPSQVIEHFASVVNCRSHVSEAIIEALPSIQASPGVSSTDDELCAPITEDEISAVVFQMKNGKAPGSDGITSEVLKLGAEVFIRWLTCIFNSIWTDEAVPSDWTKQLIVPIHKKGSQVDCDNFHGIALLSVPSKVFTKVISNRLKSRLELLLRESQCGFRKGHGCNDQIFSLRILMEKARESHQPLYVAFIDLRKAYDSVNRDALWSVLQRCYHLPEKLLSITKAVHDHSTAAIRAYSKTSDEFAVTSGVRQGCVLAPALFNLYFDIVICLSIDRCYEEGKGVHIVYHPDAKLVGDRRKKTMETLVTDLEYADDMALVSSSWSDLEVMIVSLNRQCTDMGLTIGCKKTKTLAVLPSPSCQQPEPILLSPDAEPVEPVPTFLYLESVVSQDCSTGAEVTSRIIKASQAFGSLNRKLWLQWRIKTKTKIRVFASVIIPTLLYGLECTVLLEPEVHRLQSFVMRCLCTILSISIRDNKRNTSIRKTARQQRVSTLLSQRRLRYAGHLARMDDSRLPRKLMVSALSSGKRTAGGQKCRWNDLLARDLKKIGLGEDWRSKAMDRHEWRRFVKERAQSVNEHDELKEKKQKDDKKHRREGRQMAAEDALHCEYSECTFVALNRAGLTNHTCQKHQPPQLNQCTHCNRTFNRQGQANHQRFCGARPTNN